MVPLAEALGASRAAVLEPHLVHRGVAAGETLFVQGARAPRLVYVYAGRFGVHHVVGDERIDLPEVVEGQWLGEIGFIDGQPATATVTALVDGEVLELAQDALPALIESDPRAAGIALTQVNGALGTRLRGGTDGVLTRVGTAGWQVSAPEVRRGWWARLVAALGGGA